MKLHWATDVHFDHCICNIANWASKQGSVEDILLVTGDISNCNQLAYTLKKLDEGFPGQVLFILGNHDAYHGGIGQARITAKFAQTESIRYLTEQSPIGLNQRQVGIVGHDGWYDARHGSPMHTQFELSDFELISELKLSSGSYNKRKNIVDECRRIADRYADEAEQKLRSAAKRFETIVFATHVSPYVGSSWHLGNPSDTEALPWFCSEVMGRAIDNVALDNPNRKFLVLCGHNHSDGRYQHLPNVEVLTGRAKYGEPAVWKTFVVDENGIREE